MPMLSSIPTAVLCSMLTIAAEPSAAPTAAPAPLEPTSSKAPPSQDPPPHEQQRRPPSDSRPPRPTRGEAGQGELRAPPSRPPTPSLARPGAAGVGAGLGLAFGVTAGALGIAIDVVDPDRDVAIPMGVTSLVLHGAAVPTAFGGSLAARRDPRVRGIRGLRISAWTGYGVTFGIAALAVASNADGTGVAYGLAATASAIGMSAEALVARRQALDLELVSRRTSATVSLMPAVSRRMTGLSLAGRF